MQVPPDLVRASGRPPFWERLVRLRPTHSWMVLLLCMDLATLGDLITGSDLWLGPVYLLVSCFAAWPLGWWVGQAAALSCMAVTFGINGLGLNSPGDVNLVGNFASWFATIFLVVSVVAGIRGAYVREWWRARLDPLTGALNRQAFFELGADLITERTWRLLMYADLDGLKQLNDGHGHAAGDASLRACSAVVRKAIRRDDLFARVGGDEFLIFMAVKDQAAAHAVALRLHAAMNGNQDDAALLRCSVAALLVPPGDTFLDDLVRRADDLMYQAKLRGACLQAEVAEDVRQLSSVGRARRRSRTPSISVAVPQTVRRERRTGVTIPQKRTS